MTIWAYIRHSIVIFSMLAIRDIFDNNRTGRGSDSGAYWPFAFYPTPPIVRVYLTATVPTFTPTQRSWFLVVLYAPCPHYL